MSLEELLQDFSAIRFLGLGSPAGCLHGGALVFEVDRLVVCRAGRQGVWGIESSWGISTFVMRLTSLPCREILDVPSFDLVIFLCRSLLELGKESKVLAEQYGGMGIP